MTISIYHVTFRHSGHLTLMQSVHVPNFMERIFMLRKRRKVNYIGHKSTWHVQGNTRHCNKRIANLLQSLEANLQKRYPGKRILKFK